jgi:hypothetical protein
LKQQDCFKYAYIAGLIDGEGCITILKSNGGYSLTVSINQNDGRILDYCYGVFGGTIYVNIDKRNPNKLWKWQITNEKAMEMLKKIYPFLTRKKIEAETAIEFEKHKRIFLKKWRKGFLVKGIQGIHITHQPEYMHKYKEEKYLKLQQLKRQLQEPRAAVTTN